MKEQSTLLEKYAKQRGKQIEGRSENNDNSSVKVGDCNLPQKHHIEPQRRRLSRFAINGVSINPLTSAAVTRTDIFNGATPSNIEIMDCSSLNGSNESSGIKVVSVKAPDLGIASTRSSSMLRLAKIEDIDTSQMKLVDRTVLKLRKWKASLLAEAPPLVEVHARRRHTTGSNQEARREAFAQRLAFANKQGGDRSVIDREVRSHSQSTREMISQRRRKKKEFQAVPQGAIVSRSD